LLALCALIIFKVEIADSFLYVCNILNPYDDQKSKDQSNSEVKVHIVVDVSVHVIIILTFSYSFKAICAKGVVVCGWVSSRYKFNVMASHVETVISFNPILGHPPACSVGRKAMGSNHSPATTRGCLCGCVCVK